MPFRPFALLFIFVLCCGATAFAQTNACPGNIVSDRSFNSPLGNPWQVAYNTPQISPNVSGGCGGTTGYASMWGNQAVGEGLTQAVTLTAGTTYEISFCGRYRPLASNIIHPYAHLVLRASVGVPTSPACPSTTCTTIPTNSSNVTATGWTNFRTCFTPTKNYDRITLSASNNSTASQGANEISWAEFDNICIRPITPPVINGPGSACVVPATYCISPSQAATWTVNNGTFVNAGPGCIQVNSFTTQPATITATTQPGPGGCPITVTKTIDRCDKANCCGDAVVQTNFTGPVVSGTMSNVYTLTTALSGLSGVSRVKATILSASHTYNTTGCGTAGPILSTLTAAQPNPPAGWNPPVVPLLNGVQIEWVSVAATGPLPSTFNYNITLPSPPGSLKCTETVKLCIEFEFTSTLPNGACRTCRVVRCHEFKRQGGIQVDTIGDPSKD
jgi:hypothetical protein